VAALASRQDQAGKRARLSRRKPQRLGSSRARPQSTKVDAPPSPAPSGTAEAQRPVLVRDLQDHVLRMDPAALVIVRDGSGRDRHLFYVREVRASGVVGSLSGVWRSALVLVLGEARR
jgi:hypothetical protein